MTRLFASVAIALLAGGLAACGGGDEPRRVAARERLAPAATPQAPAYDVGRLGHAAPIRAQANIYGAGHELPPAPGGGGGGALPPVWQLPKGRHRVVSFAHTSGRVNPIVGHAQPNGPAGDGVGGTDVTSYGGISGIVHDRNGMFLVGVFLGDEAPANPAPRTLDFTRRERVGSLAPRVGQTFLVGDGKGRSYGVPSRATRLFLGFADGFLYKGPPGWYGNNAGKLSVTVELAGD